MKLSDIIPNCELQSPEPAMIVAVELELGVTFPNELRALYEECNGLREPLGNTSYVWPLFGETSLVRMTKFFRDEVKSIAPNAPDFADYLFFGSSSADESWAIGLTEPNKIIRYHHHMGGEYEIVGEHIHAVFEADQAILKELDPQ